MSKSRSPIGLPDWTLGTVIHEHRYPVTLTKSEVLGKAVSTTKAEEVYADFDVGDKALKSLAILTDVPAIVDYLYCLILDETGAIVGEPIPSANKVPVFGAISIEFKVAWLVPEKGKVRVVCYGDRAKNFQVSIEVVS